MKPLINLIRTTTPNTAYSPTVQAELEKRGMCCAIKNGFECAACKQCTNCLEEYYMLTDEAWISAATANGLKDGKGMLCIGCVENGLGRKLRSEDFSDVPLNSMYLPFYGKSPRLVSRLLSIG